MQELREELKNRNHVPRAPAAAAVAVPEVVEHTDALVRVLESINNNIVLLNNNVTNAIITSSSNNNKVTPEDMKPLTDPLHLILQNVRRTAEFNKGILHVQKRLREDFNDLFEDAADIKMASNAAKTQKTMTDIVAKYTSVIPTVSKEEEEKAPHEVGLRESMIIDKDTFAQDEMGQ
jgi:hypothetical protein